MRWHPILLMTALLLGMCGNASLAQAAEKSATECISAAEAALQRSYKQLGSPVTADSAALEKIVEGAKDDLRKLVWGDPAARVTTSVLSGKIKIWANCSGEELSHDWLPSNSPSAQ